MQRFALTFALLLALLPWAPPADAGERIQSTKKLGRTTMKNYYVVREPKSTDCRVEAKKVPKDAIMVGKRPYAGEQYAKAALETFRECKPEGTKSVE